MPHRATARPAGRFRPRPPGKVVGVNAMARERVAAPPERVWAVLADGWLYAGWVVGAAHIRRVEPGWPAAGARLHHKVGPWPLTIADTTSSLSADPPRELVLRARGWPLGEATVRIVVEADGDGSVVTMEETPSAGPGAWVHNRVTDAALRARNTESLARLRDMAEGGAR